MTNDKCHVLFLNRSYWPDAEATGQLLTELCQDLADDFDVTVVAGQPNHNPQRAAFRRRGLEFRHGVRIRRVWNTRFPKTLLLGRVCNLLTYLLFAALAAFRGPRPGLVVVETDPPLLCLLGALLQRFRRAKLVVYLQDIYPDLAVALGKLPEGPLVRALRRLMFAVYRRADRVIVLSRDMRQLLIASGVPADRVVCIPNWIDTAGIVPLKRDNPFRSRHRLDGRFVVAYSGNMGLCQGLEHLVAAASHLADRPDVLLLLMGEGATRAALQAQVARLGLANVRFLPYQPKADLAASLSAADLHLVPIDPRVVRFLMPSKLYGVLASGTPLIAVAPRDCELAAVTLDYAVGHVVPPGDPRALAASIRWAADHPRELAAMGLRARRLAESHYGRRRITPRFAQLFNELLAPSVPTSPLPPFPPSSSAGVPGGKAISVPQSSSFPSSPLPASTELATRLSSPKSEVPFSPSSSAPSASSSRP